MFPSKKSMKIRSVIVAGFRWVEFCLPQAFGVSLLALLFLSATPAQTAERQLLQSNHVPPVVKASESPVALKKDWPCAAIC